MKCFTKYESLVKVLDMICLEAPIAFKSYRPPTTDTEAVNYARSRAFLHLYLKVKYGLLKFEDREHYITDGPGDGGVDAYFVDGDRKKVIFIQAKFCTKEDNFEEKQISIDELLSIEVSRITEGEQQDAGGTRYNGKILQLQRELSEIRDIGRYSYDVVILANLRVRRTSALQRLTGGFPTEVFDFEKSYTDLVFPVISGTYFNEPELYITLDLTNTVSSNARINYNVKTAYKECDISVVFVPTSEIARILYQYKNSILKYNPRSYLELSKNEVNRDISSSITDKTTNEFSLFNNGITMLSEGTSFNERIGARDKAQVIVLNPQVINGGQTAYTLSRLYEDVQQGRLDLSIFNGKEVLLKIITFDVEGEQASSDRLKLIEDISKATNWQTAVTVADRRSNDKIQIEFQNEIFSRFGYYYERKLGEFADGLKDRYISQDQIINREIFLRVCMACNLFTAEARRNSAKQIFVEDNISKNFTGISRIPEFFFGYMCYLSLTEIERGLAKKKSDRFGTSKYGQALRYGKYAVVSVCKGKSADFNPETANETVTSIIRQWPKFEKFAVQQKHNESYFAEDTTAPATGKVKMELNYSNYYKGRTISADLKSYFKIKQNG